MTLQQKYDLLLKTLIHLVGSSDTEELSEMRQIVHDMAGDTEDGRDTVASIDALLSVMR